MIPLVQEPEDFNIGFPIYECCYFKCGNKTKYWHLRTNQPVCKECSKKHKVSEIEKSTLNYKPITK